MSINIEIFLLITVRIASFMVSSPIFTVKGTPNLVKIGFAFTTAYLIKNSVPPLNLEDVNMFFYIILIIKETLIGLILGYITNLIFYSIQMAGQLIDNQVGFAMASTLDPMSGQRAALYGRLYYWFGIVLFFLMNGHHFLIYGLFKSFQLVPINSVILNQLSITNIIYIFSRSFTSGFIIAVPLVIIIFLTNIIIGLLARTVPQLNIFVLGMPLKVLIGLLATLILLPSISNQLSSVIEGIPHYIDYIIDSFTN